MQTRPFTFFQVSVFGKSMWEYREERGQFYLHQFLPGQPDLNYRSQNIVEEIKDVFRDQYCKTFLGVTNSAAAK